MERLSDYLVFCDMDNTLLTAKEGIPACNRSVIRLFTAMGGRFTVASGRPPESIRAALGERGRTCAQEGFALARQMLVRALDGAFGGV